MYTAEQSYEFALLLLCIWREARGESLEAKKAVAWCVRNRVMKEGKQWYGNDWTGVILKPYQFSSFNPNDPNATKIPLMSDPSFNDCKMAAKYGYDGMGPDPTQGATYYFDDSIAADPPKWAKDFTPTVKIGRLNFFKEKPL